MARSSWYVAELLGFSEEMTDICTMEVIEMFEGEYHPGNCQALQNMLAKYRKEPRCLLPDAEKQVSPR